ncbi:unnamed protein product [Bursaphelenchus xylophilus]|uniref:(pine wood nematode) hypothetical protein n=1 Tax=Bursaphelenchus xylophilus TaxID=6326 RepID=A0A7I8X877_BURXY|nr:unnamed protein product [Bursaphelenchus xylophilus]CAG9125895.1 unnamed protein product [Bursaphelenchus xylophilus]
MVNISSAPLSPYLEVYRANHTIAATTGFVLNLFLFVVIRECTRNSTQPAKVLLMVSTAHDLWYCAFELFLRRVIYQTDGIMYVLAFGWDAHFSSYFNYLLGIIHFFNMTQNMMVQTVIHRFRYHIVCSTTPPDYRFLFRNLLMFALPSLYLSLSLKVALISGTEKSYDSAMTQLPEEWRLVDGSSNVVEVALWDDKWTKIFVLNNCLVAGVAYHMCLHYIRMCYSSINRTQLSSSVSSKTIDHRGQFNRCLVAQTVCMTILIIIPSALWCLNFITKAHGLYLGLPSMICLSWFGAINASIPLVYVKTVRRCALDILFCRRRNAPDLSTMSKVDETNSKSDRKH